VPQKPRVALLGAPDPLGEELIALLGERDIAVGELHPLSLDDSDETVGDLPVGHVDAFDWRQADILVVATHAAAARRHVEAALSQGCAVICPDGDVNLAGGEVLPFGSGLAVAAGKVLAAVAARAGLDSVRSEERRVGKECRRLCRSRWSPYH
jgi:hypothetical protein